MLEAMVVTVFKALAEPDRRVSVIVPWSDGCQVMVVAEPAWRAPPVGAVIGLLWAETYEAKVATAAKMVENFIFPVSRLSRWCFDGCWLE
jgi:hypothetical protein